MINLLHSFHSQYLLVVGIITDIDWCNNTHILQLVLFDLNFLGGGLLRYPFPFTRQVMRVIVCDQIYAATALWKAQSKDEEMLYRHTIR